jgi:hypothetical protein
MSETIKHAIKTLGGSVLFEAEIRGDTPSGLVVRHALEQATQKRADLRGAYLSGADLSGADLSGADLSGAYLSGAYLRDAKGLNAHCVTPLLMLRWINPDPFAPTNWSLQKAKAPTTAASNTPWGNPSQCLMQIPIRWNPVVLGSTSQRWTGA